MPKVEPKVEYKVTYEQNPEYDGEFQTPIVPGLQGTFRFKHEATAAAKRCKDWFNQEKSLVDEPGPDGKIVEVQNVEFHDNVIVKIAKFVDDVEVEDTCEEEKEAPKKKGRQLATA